MAGLKIETQPLVEPVSLAEAKNWCRVEFSDDDDLISGLITTAREWVESFTSRTLVNTGYLQSLDSFPYFTDTVMSQMAYPPSYYSLPRYATTLWNYSQLVKLFRSPLFSVDSISYLASSDSQWHSLVPVPPIWYPNEVYSVAEQVTDGNGNIQQANNGGTSGFNAPTWNATVGGTTSDNGITWTNKGPAPKESFIADIVNEPPRIFPGPAGSFWPSVLYVPNAVQIHFTAGYGAAVPIYDASGSIITGYTPPANMPERCVTAIKMLVANWYENREAASALTLKEIPNHIKSMLWSLRVYDAQPTRG